MAHAPRASLMLVSLVAAAVLAQASRAAAEQARRVVDVAERTEAARGLLAKLGLKAKFGAVEAGDRDESLVIRDVELDDAGRRKHTIERIEIRRFDWREPEHPRYLAARIAKLVVQLDGAAQEAAFGFASLTADLELEYRFDDAEKTFEIGRLVVDVAELGKLRLRLKILDVPHADYRHYMAMRDRSGPDYETAMARLAVANFAGATLSFRDKSLIERLVRRRAKAKGISDEAAKAGLLAELAAARAKADDAALRELFDAAAKFVAAPGEISVSANPPPGISLMMLTLVMLNPAILGLSVTVHQR